MLPSTRIAGLAEAGEEEELIGRFPAQRSGDCAQDALALPPEAHMVLVDPLIGSLDQAVDAGAEEAWREEVYRRLQPIDGEAV